MPTRKKSPEIIDLRQPKVNTLDQDIPHVEPDPERLPIPLFPNRTPISVELEAFVKERVHEELQDVLDEHDDRLARAFYKVVMDWPIAEIMVIGQEQFVALVRSAREDEA